MVRRTSGWQLSCSLLELLGLMMWIGSLTALLTMVIPAVFNTLGMETGGRFLRRVFDGYNAVVVGVVVVLIGTASFRYWKHWQEPKENPPLKRSEVGLLTALTFVTVLVVAVMGPKAVALQEIAFEADSQEAKKTALEAFFPNAYDRAGPSSDQCRAGCQFACGQVPALGSEPKRDRF